MRRIRNLVASALSRGTGRDDRLPGLLAEWRAADLALKMQECAFSARLADSDAMDIAEDEWAALQVLQLREQQALDAVVARIRELRPGVAKL